MKRIVSGHGKKVKIVESEEFKSLIETAYLLSSPANADRLFKAIKEADRQQGKKMTIDELRRTVGLGG